MDKNKPKYDFKDKKTKIDSHDDIASKIDSFDFKKDIHKLDEQNPLEHAIKFNKVKENPPKPGYMKVELYHEKDENGNDIIISEAPDTDKKDAIIKIKHDPFFYIDLNTAIMSNIAQSPMNVVPMLIDQAEQLVWEEKKAFKPEKRKEEFNYWWIVFIILIIIGIAPLLFILLPK